MMPSPSFRLRALRPMYLLLPSLLLLLLLLPLCLCLCLWTACANSAHSMELEHWERIMEEVMDPLVNDVLPRELGETPNKIDFDGIENLARRGAKYYAEGYQAGGRLRFNKEKERQAAMLAETWFLEIVQAAKLHKPLALVSLLHRQHRMCTQCHE